MANAIPADTSPSTEAISMAAEMSQALGRHVDLQIKQLGISPEAAIARLNGDDSEFHLQRELNCVPDQVTWAGLSFVARHDPEAAEGRWIELKEAARAELRSGYRAAKATEGQITASPWDRARFLALRDELAGEWKPQNGIEWTLIDAMAQAWTAQFFWNERMMLFACLDSDNARIKAEGRWETPRVTDFAAVGQAAQMVDRFNQMFVRCLRALRDLRKLSPTLVVQNAGQVNVGEQQVNVAGAE